MPTSDTALYHLLKDFRTELILFMMAVTYSKSVKKSISKYYNELRKTHPTISGNDLIQMGLSPGPEFKRILAAILEEKLNGKLESREDELRFVQNWMNT